MTLDHFILPAWASSTPIDMGLLSAKPSRLYPLYSPPTSSRMRSAILGPTRATCRSSSSDAVITRWMDPKWRSRFLATLGPTLGMADIRYSCCSLSVLAVLWP